MGTQYTYSINTKVIPNRVFYKGRSTEITEVDDHLIIKGYKIVIEDDKIKKIILNNGSHPNVDPHTREYCIPYTLRDIPLTADNVQKIEDTMEIFNLTSCYEIPYGFFKVADNSIWSKGRYEYRRK